VSKIQPVLQFRSHIEGKNAVVSVWADRIEWRQNIGAGVGRAAARWTAAASMGGLSLLATGVDGRNTTSSVIPIKMIQGVSTARKGVRFTTVVVATAGSSVEFHVVSNDAENIKNTITNVMMNGRAATPTPIAVHVAAPRPSSVAPATSSIVSCRRTGQAGSASRHRGADASGI
jgi:hypothetical protein